MTQSHVSTENRPYVHFLYSKPNKHLQVAWLDECHSYIILIESLIIGSFAYVRGDFVQSEINPTLKAIGTHVNKAKVILNHSFMADQIFMATGIFLTIQDLNFFI